MKNKVRVRSECGLAIEVNSRVGIDTLILLRTSVIYRIWWLRYIFLLYPPPVIWSAAMVRDAERRRSIPSIPSVGLSTSKEPRTVGCLAEFPYWCRFNLRLSWTSSTSCRLFRLDFWAGAWIWGFGNSFTRLDWRVCRVCRGVELGCRSSCWFTVWLIIVDWTLLGLRGFVSIWWGRRRVCSFFLLSFLASIAGFWGSSHETFAACGWEWSGRKSPDIDGEGMGAWCLGGLEPSGTLSTKLSTNCSTLCRQFGSMSILSSDGCGWSRKIFSSSRDWRRATGCSGVLCVIGDGVEERLGDSIGCGGGGISSWWSSSSRPSMEPVGSVFAVIPWSRGEPGWGCPGWSAIDLLGDRSLVSCSLGRRLWLARRGLKACAVGMGVRKDRESKTTNDAKLY